MSTGSCPHPALGRVRPQDGTPKNTYATQEHREALPSGVTNRAPGDKVATKSSVCAAVLV